MYTDDYDQFDRNQAVTLSRLPRCAKCGEPIQSEKAYDIDGFYCEDCFNEWVEEISNYTDELEDF